MRVLAHVHTLNDKDFIGQALEGLARQTRQPDGIVIVDNGSKDGTVDRTFPDNVTVIRNGMNLGTSGAIIKGLIHAQEHGYDWTWVFDADSVPEPDALEKLLSFYESLPPSDQERVCFLACQLENAESEVRHRPMTFTGTTLAYNSVDETTAATECDCFIWTGSLFSMAAVNAIGLPDEHYVLDVAEVEYGYRARELGFTSYMVHDCTTHQDVGRNPGVVVARAWKVGRFKIAFREVSAIRTYYISRNLLYFWLYQYKPLNKRRVIHSLANIFVFSGTFVLRPVSHRRQLIASARGIWDGLTGHMERRY